MRLWITLLIITIFIINILASLYFIDRYFFGTMKQVVGSIEASRLDAGEIYLSPTNYSKKTVLVIYGVNQYQRQILSETTCFSGFKFTYNKGYRVVYINFYDSVNRYYSNQFNYISTSKKYYFYSQGQGRTYEYYFDAPPVMIYDNNRVTVVSGNETILLYENLTIDCSRFTVSPSNIGEYIVVKCIGNNIWGCITVYMYPNTRAAMVGGVSNRGYWLINDGTDGRNVVEPYRIYYIEPGLYRIGFSERVYPTRDIYSIILNVIPWFSLFIILAFIAIFMYSYRR